MTEIVNTDFFEVLDNEITSEEGAVALNGLRELVLSQRCTIRDLQARLQMSEMQKLSDELTGLSNRRAFNSDVASWAYELSQYEHERRNEVGQIRHALLLIFDLDNFKLINDVLGYYQAGDQTLRIVADVLRDSIRHYDKAYRLGGDEFAVIAPVAPGKEDAAYHSIVERFRYKLDVLRLEAVRPRTELASGRFNSIEAEAVCVVDATFARGIFCAGSSADNLEIIITETMDTLKRLKDEKNKGIR